MHSMLTRDVWYQLFPSTALPSVNVLPSDLLSLTVPNVHGTASNNKCTNSHNSPLQWLFAVNIQGRLTTYQLSMTPWMAVTSYRASVARACHSHAIILLTGSRRGSVNGEKSKSRQPSRQFASHCVRPSLHPVDSAPDCYCETWAID